jgi:CheY-like chemotaxis protein
LPKVCFVIAPIGSTDSEIRGRSDQIFEQVIEPAARQRGYEPVRSDQISQPGLITSQMIEHLMNDDLVIADLTGRNPNVYYELALRHGFKKPVIQIKEVSESLPFDIIGMRTIDVDYRFVKSMQKCKEEIAKQIQLIEKDPSRIESPITLVEQSKSVDNLLSQIRGLRSEIEELKERQTVNYMERIKDLQDIRDDKLVELAQNLPQPVIPSKDVGEKKSRPKVLWVDDNPANNETIINVYREQGVEFDIATDTSQALSYISSRNYDLIISDMGRGLDRDAGLLMVRQINRTFQNHPPIFIYASQRAVENYGRSARQEGASFVTSSPRDLVLKMIETISLNVR